MAQHAKINTHFAQLFATFLERLRDSPEGDGSVLDHSLIAFGAGMSDGQAHSAYPLPLATVGGAGGKMKGNRFSWRPNGRRSRISGYAWPACSAARSSASARAPAVEL